MKEGTDLLPPFPLIDSETTCSPGTTTYQDCSPTIYHTLTERGEQKNLEDAQRLRGRRRRTANHLLFCCLFREAWEGLNGLFAGTLKLRHDQNSNHSSLGA